VLVALWWIAERLSLAKSGTPAALAQALARTGEQLAAQAVYQRLPRPTSTPC
jgi:hypothetical protein